MSDNPFILYFDGACEWWNGKRNPGGLATYGWYIELDGQRIAWGYGEAARGNGATNNVAEYMGLISAIKAASDLGLVPDFIIRGDSQLVIRQMAGTYSVNSPLLLPLWSQAKTLLSEMDAYCSFEWVPREENEQADELSKRAYQLSKSKQGIWSERFKVNGGPK